MSLKNLAFQLVVVGVVIAGAATGYAIISPSNQPASPSASQVNR